jgi:Ca2+-binding EF-hand superfamily protein
MRRCGGASARRAVPRATMIDLQPARAHCEKIFAAVDANADGRISKREFLAFIKAQPRPSRRDKTYMTSDIGLAVASIDGQDPRKVFDRLDKNHDGYIDRVEAGLD